MISDFAVGHIRSFRFGDTLLFGKIYLHSLDVNLTSTHPVTQAMEKLRDHGVIEEIPDSLKSDKLQKSYPIDPNWPGTEDAELMTARAVDAVLDSTVRHASLALRTGGRSCTLLTDEQALLQNKSKVAESVTAVRINMVRVDPALDTPAEKILAMRADPDVTAAAQNFHSFFNHVAQYGFDVESIERFMYVLDDYRQHLATIHDVSMEKDSLLLYASDELAANTKRLRPDEPYEEMFSAALAYITVFQPELDLGGTPLALLR